MRSRARIAEANTAVWTRASSVAVGPSRRNRCISSSIAASTAFMLPCGLTVAVIVNCEPISNGPMPTSTLVALWSRSEEHTSELQSLMRISYAVFCLKKKKDITNIPNKSNILTEKALDNHKIQYKIYKQ